MTSTRKGNKKLAIYDVKITMKWEAQAEDDAEQVCSQKAESNHRFWNSFLQASGATAGAAAATGDE